VEVGKVNMVIAKGSKERSLDIMEICTREANIIYLKDLPHKCLTHMSEKRL